MEKQDFKFVDMGTLQKDTIKALYEYALMNSFSYFTDIKKTNVWKREPSELGFKDALNLILNCDYIGTIYLCDESNYSINDLKFWKFGLSSLARNDFDIFVWISVSEEIFEKIRYKYNLIVK